MDILNDELLPIIIKKDKKDDTEKKSENKPKLSENIDTFFDKDFIETFFTLNKLSQQDTKKENKK